jgi:hypothetical protein
VALSWHCNFPLLGNQPMTTTVSMALPRDGAAGKVVIDGRLAPSVTSGLHILDAAVYYGTLHLGASITTGGTPTPNTIHAPIEPTLVPPTGASKFVAKASTSGTDAKNLTVRATDATLSLALYSRTGPVDVNFSWISCALDPGQNNVLIKRGTTVPTPTPVVTPSPTPSVTPTPTVIPDPPPRVFQLNYSCALPLIGAQPMRLVFSQVGGEASATAYFGTDTTNGLATIAATSIEGSIGLASELYVGSGTDGGSFPITLTIGSSTIQEAGGVTILYSAGPMVLPPLPSSGGKIVAGDVTLHLVLKSGADQIPIDYSAVPCTLDPGQDATIWSVPGIPTPTP